MDWPLTPAEAALTRVMADWMIKDVIWRLAPNGETSFHDLAQSNFEACCPALARLGLLEEKGPGTWSIRVPADRPVTLPKGYVRRDLDQLLDAFACHSFYVPDLHDHANPIVPSDPALHAVCAALGACGYLQAEGDAWVWTERFHPWLCYHSAILPDALTSAPTSVRDAALRTMPPDVRDWLTRSFTTHFPDFLRLLFGYWTGDGWRGEIEHIHAPDETWDMGLAVALYRTLHPKTH